MYLLYLLFNKEAPHTFKDGVEFEETGKILKN